MLGEEFVCDFDESPETTISVLGAALRLLAGKDAYVSKLLLGLLIIRRYPSFKTYELQMLVVSFLFVEPLSESEQLKH